MNLPIQKITFSNSVTDLSIEILRYQFPDSNCEYDSQWLVIELSIFNKVNNTTRIAQDPSLMSSELYRMKNWFEQVSTASISNHKIQALQFMEPCLAFKHELSSTIIVNLFAELAAKETGIEEYRFELTSLEISQIMETISDWINIFQKRKVK